MNGAVGERFTAIRYEKLPGIKAADFTLAGLSVMRQGRDGRGMQRNQARLGLPHSK
jgi:hypothetical protein